MKKRNLKSIQLIIYTFIVICLLFLIGVTKNCERIKNVQQIGYSGGDTLDIAMIYTPSSLYLYTDSLSGINIEIAREFSKQTSKPIKIWPIADVAEAMAKVESGAFDILSSLPLDNNIKKRFPTSESIFLDRLVLVQLTDSTKGNDIIKSSIDLSGKEVHITAGSSAMQRLQNLSEEIGGTINIIEEDITDELLCLKVASGEIPLAVVNEKTAVKVADQYPLLSFDNPVSFTQFQIWIFNREDSLERTQFINWFDGFRKTDTYREIINRY